MTQQLQKEKRVFAVPLYFDLEFRPLSNVRSPFSCFSFHSLVSGEAEKARAQPFKNKIKEEWKEDGSEKGRLQEEVREMEGERTGSKVTIKLSDSEK